MVFGAKEVGSNEDKERRIRPQNGRDLKEWSATIDEYEADASRMAVGYQEEFARTIRDLKEKRDLLANRLRELEGSTSEAWIGLRTDVRKATHDLAQTFAHAREVMKKAA